MTRIAIVGAGFSGLAAAVDLADAGVDVIVLEARDRVGGRVWSEPLDGPGGSGPIIERGAEYVIEGYDHMRRWLTRFGLELADTGMSYYVREPHGVENVTVDDMREAAEALKQIPREPGESVAELLAQLNVRPEVAQAVAARIQVSCAYSVEHLDVSVVDHAGSFAPLPSYRVAGGNQRLALAMAEWLGDRVRLSSPVSSIAWTEQSAKITTADGVDVVDAVIITVPLPHLIDFAFSPALPADRLAALGRMAMGNAAKAHVGLRSPAPTSAVLAVPHLFWCWTATGLDGTVLPVLNSFAGSDEAVAALDAVNGPTVWAARLAEMRPDLDLDLDTTVITTWHNDPWALGAYTAETVGIRPGDVDTFAAPLGALHFAGEHTAGAWAGLMEGALRSGSRAAGDVLSQR